MISNNGGDIFPIFFRFFINHGCSTSGYFTSETIMALSDGNITTFFIQKQHNITLQCNVMLCSQYCLMSAAEINMLLFICSLFLNEKSSNISIRKRHYSFTGKISRSGTTVIDKKSEKNRKYVSAVV